MPEVPRHRDFRIVRPARQVYRDPANGESLDRDALDGLSIELVNKLQAMLASEVPQATGSVAMEIQPLVDVEDHDPSERFRLHGYGTQ